MDFKTIEKRYTNVGMNTKLSDAEFSKLSSFIKEHYGIKLPPQKKVMLEARLAKRLRFNKIASYSDYCKYVFSEEGMKQEVVHMIDAVSTNKTSFFREPSHFDFMKNTLLPNWIEENRGRPLNIWSSAASTGEEVYTLAIVMEEFLQLNKHVDYMIHGTDISTKALDTARKAVYDMPKIEKIPLETKRKFFLRSKDTINPTAKVAPKLRERIKLGRLNLTDDAYKMPLNYDAVFCRNVIIYFDKELQLKVIRNLCKHLRLGGYLFLGHSESITNMDVPLKQVIPTVFRKI